MLVLSRQGGAVSSVLHKLCSILSLLKELLPISKLLDSCVLQLLKTMLDTFGVDNIQLLQLKAIGVVCTVCINICVPSDIRSVSSICCVSLIACLEAYNIIFCPSYVAQLLRVPYLNYFCNHQVTSE